MQDPEAHPPPSAPLSLAKSHDSSIWVSPWFPPESAHLSQAGGQGMPTQATGLFGKRERKNLARNNTSLPARSAQHITEALPEPPSWADPRPQFTGSTLGANRDRLRLPHRDPDSWPRKASAEAAHGPRGDSSPELFQMQKRAIGRVITNNGRDRQLLNGGNRSTNCRVCSITAKME